MGGWIALHLALLRPERVQALVGIAAAPDFTQWGFTDEAGERSSARGPMTRHFWESGQRLLLLDGEIGDRLPGPAAPRRGDEEVPLEIAVPPMRALRSSDVQLNVLKGGGHRLSEPHEIDAILRTVTTLLEPAP